MGRATVRFWSGQEWTSWVWDRTKVVSDRHPVRRPLNRSDVDHLDLIFMVFLGLVALLVVSFLEQGKIAAHKGLSRFGEATAGWE